MENNTLPQTPLAPQVPPTPSQPQSPLPNPATIVTPEGDGKGAKMMKYVLIGIVVLILVGGVATYFYMNQQNQKEKAASQAVSTEDIDEELSKEELQDVEGDFTEVDKDLETL